MKINLRPFKTCVGTLDRPVVDFAASKAYRRVKSMAYIYDNVYDIIHIKAV